MSTWDSGLIADTGLHKPGFAVFARRLPARRTRPRRRRPRRYSRPLLRLPVWELAIRDGVGGRIGSVVCVYSRGRLVGRRPPRCGSGSTATRPSRCRSGAFVRVLATGSPRRHQRRQRKPDVAHGDRLRPVSLRPARLIKAVAGPGERCAPVALEPQHEPEHGPAIPTKTSTSGTRTLPPASSRPMHDRRVGPGRAVGGPVARPSGAASRSTTARSPASPARRPSSPATRRSRRARRDGAEPDHVPPERGPPPALAVEHEADEDEQRAGDDQRRRHVTPARAGRPPPAGTGARRRPARS